MKNRFILLKSDKGNRLVRADLIAMLDDADTMNQEERYFQKMKEFHGDFKTIVSIDSKTTENIPEIQGHPPRTYIRSYEKFFTTTTINEILKAMREN